jgi:uncharacterized protein involved in exopolysaccharide biosynthesis
MYGEVKSSRICHFQQVRLFLFSICFSAEIVKENQNDNSLLDVISCMRKRIVGMVIIFVVVVAVVVITTLKMTPIYEVESRILVKYGREYVYNSIDRLKRGDVTPNYNFDVVTILNTEIEIIKSHELSGEVVASIGGERLFPELYDGSDPSYSASFPGLLQDVQAKTSLQDIAVSMFNQKLNVAHVKNSNVISVSLQHSNPVVAVDAVTDVIERFKDRHLEIFKNSEIPFLEAQLARYAAELKEAEEAKSLFKQDNDVYDLAVQREIYMQHYANFDAMLVTERAVLEGLTEKQITLSKRMETIPKEIILYEESRQQANNEFTEDRLLQYRLKERELLLKYPPENRLVVAVRNEIKMVEQFIEEAGSTQLGTTRVGKNPLYGQLQKDLSILEMRLEGQKKKVLLVQSKVDESKEDLVHLSNMELNITRMTARVKAANFNYANFRNNLDEVRVQAVMDSEKLVSVVVIDKPRVPLKPIKPRKKLRLLVGIILGLAGAFFYALLAEYVLVSKK